MDHSLSGERPKGSWGLISQPLFPGCTAHAPLHKHLKSQEQLQGSHLSLQSIMSLEVHLEFQWSMVINTLSHNLSSKFLEGGVHEAPAIPPSSWTYRWPLCPTKTKTKMHGGRDGHSCLINAAGDLLNLPSCYFLSCVSFLFFPLKKDGVYSLKQKTMGKESGKGKTQRALVARKCDTLVHEPKQQTTWQLTGFICWV